MSKRVRNAAIVPHRIRIRAGKVERIGTSMYIKNSNSWIDGSTAWPERGGPVQYMDTLRKSFAIALVKFSSVYLYKFYFVSWSV